MLCNTACLFVILQHFPSCGQVGELALIVAVGVGQEGEVPRTVKGSPIGGVWAFRSGREAQL